MTHFEGLALGTSVSGLSAYSSYEFTVSACTTAGCLNTSVEAVTLQGPPHGQLRPNVTAQGPTALKVIWQPPTQPNGNIIHRNVSK